MKKKVYIIGKMEGSPEHEVREKFLHASAQIESFGHTPVSPFETGKDFKGPWTNHVLACLALELECDCIYLLTDWDEDSKSKIEHFVAKELDLEILEQPSYGKYHKRE